MLARHSIALLATVWSSPTWCLDFDRTFRSDAAIGASYYAATYQRDGHDHHVEVWRDGLSRLRRRTDDAVEVHLDRALGDVEWTMTVLDLKRRIRTDVRRTNLLRIGHFTDWSEQADSLTRPVGPYRLTRLAHNVPDADPISACRWFELVEARRTSSICWSARMHVPLIIADADRRIVWRITRLASTASRSSDFAIDDRGYVRNDANVDMAGD